MRCPYCYGEDSEVKDSRPVDWKQKVKRRRRCKNCGKKFTTYELYEFETGMSIDKEYLSNLLGYAIDHLNSVIETLNRK